MLGDCAQNQRRKEHVGQQHEDACSLEQPEHGAGEQAARQGSHGCTNAVEGVHRAGGTQHGSSLGVELMQHLFLGSKALLDPFLQLGIILRERRDVIPRGVDVDLAGKIALDKIALVLTHAAPEGHRGVIHSVDLPATKAAQLLHKVPEPGSAGVEHMLVLGQVALRSELVGTLEGVRAQVGALGEEEIHPPMAHTLCVSGMKRQHAIDMGLVVLPVAAQEDKVQHLHGPPNNGPRLHLLFDHDEHPRQNAAFDHERPQQRPVDPRAVIRDDQGTILKAQSISREHELDSAHVLEAQRSNRAERVSGKMLPPEVQGPQRIQHIARIDVKHSEEHMRK
eukprot:CAMPEP_0196775568 /NCGR_PEP_ID=MMETSP1104-20130614/4105_1 /TAXON_ID=33652 /ORGANISM="Cafeteria sp., Strain Caron Lab Isolate" /LENGTH=336 /DNA_ID=CAMNT_0042145737 /DNA_START=44 /DNA_END=1051 /DNA_ORIENTATION=-